MYAFSHGFSWVSVDVQLALKGTYIKKYPFFKKIILVIIFIVLFLAIKNDFAPLYLGILGIAIVSWVTTPNETRQIQRQKPTNASSRNQFKIYRKLNVQTLIFFQRCQHSNNWNRLCCLCDQRDNEMTIQLIKNIIWNLLGIFIYLCVGIGAVFHTVLGY